MAKGFHFEGFRAGKNYIFKVVQINFDKKMINFY